MPQLLRDLTVLAVAALCLRFVPETVLARRRPTMRFAGLSIPERGRGQFIAAAVAAFAAFALLGLFSSLVPGFTGWPRPSGAATSSPRSSWPAMPG